MDCIYYFGYGANANPKRIEGIINHKPKKEYGGVIGNFRLCIQTLNQIPEPAKNILKSAWGDDFLAYTLSPGSGFVSGVLWQLTPSDFSKVKEWEELGGWRKFVPVEVTIYDGTKKMAVTDLISSEDQSLFGCVDGVNYPYDLNGSYTKTVGQSPEDKEITIKIELVRKRIRKLLKEKNHNL